MSFLYGLCVGVLLYGFIAFVLHKQQERKIKKIFDNLDEKR